MIAAALELLAARGARERPRAELQIGRDQLDRGEFVENTPGLMKRIKREGIEDAKLGKPVDVDVMF